MKNTLKLFAALFISILILNGCKKESAATPDAIDPVITLRITGGGSNKLFTSEETLPTGQFNFKPETKYNFTMTMADSGGLKLLRFRLSKGDIQNLIVNTSPVCVDYSTTLEHGYAYTETDETNPYKSYLITGEFNTPFVQSADLSLNFAIEGRDFTPNRTNLYINGNLTDNPAGGYGWVIF